MKEIRIIGDSIKEFIKKMRSNLPSGWKFDDEKDDEYKVMPYSAKFYYFNLNFSTKKYRVIFVLNLDKNVLTLTNITRVDENDSILSEEYDSIIDKTYLELLSLCHSFEDIKIEIKYLGKSAEEE